MFPPWCVDYEVVYLSHFLVVHQETPYSFLSMWQLKRKSPIRSWDKDIVCLPNDYGGSSIPIPWGSRRTILGEFGLIGKVHLTSKMTEDVKSEIRSVFSRPMKFDPNFPFTFLKSTGGGTDSNVSGCICSFSVDYVWLHTLSIQVCAFHNYVLGVHMERKSASQSSIPKLDRHYIHKPTKWGSTPWLVASP